MMITLKFVSDFFFPPLCAACDDILPSNHSDALCAKCRVKWESAKSSARSVYSGAVVVPLEIVTDTKNFESFVASLVNYRPMTLERGFAIQKQLIYRTKKYNFKLLNEFFAEELEQLILEVMGNAFHPENTIITSIPRNPKNYIKTANNGVKNIARRLADKLDIEYSDIFVKNLFTREQKSLSVAQRRKNGGGLCVVSQSVHKFDDKDVIILDDVVTTGTTVTEAATLIADKTRARRVYIFSIAQSSALERSI